MSAAHLTAHQTLTEAKIEADQIEDAAQRSARVLDRCLDAQRKKLFRRADRFGVADAALEFWLLPGSNLTMHVWNGNSIFARGSNGEIARKSVPGDAAREGRVHVLRWNGRIDKDWREY